MQSYQRKTIEEDVFATSNGHSPDLQVEHERLLYVGWRLAADGCYRKVSQASPRRV